MFGHVAIEFALCGLPKEFSREVPTMCFDGVARVSRAAAQLAFFVAVALDAYQGKAIGNVFIDSLFVNALPVPMLETGKRNTPWVPQSASTWQSADFSLTRKSFCIKIAVRVAPRQAQRQPSVRCIRLTVVPTVKVTKDCFVTPTDIN